MGADFLMYPVPLCALTTERRLLAEQAIQGISREETLAMLEDADGVVAETEAEEESICLDFKKQLLEDLDFFADPYTREVIDWIPPGCDRGFLITGGMSWGDSPTHAADIFNRLICCGVLWELFNQWAVEDERLRREAEQNSPRPENEQ